MKLFDCSMRDGGYLNNWYFSKEQARACYSAVKDCGIEYCEIGFRRNEHINGPWFYTPESLIKETFENIVVPECKLALMAQMGTFTIDDFVPRSESLISMVRVLIAYHCKDKDDTKLDIELIIETVDMCKKLRDLGYEVCINIGRIEKISDYQLMQIFDIIKDIPIEYFYIADTYGNLGIYKMRNILLNIKKYYNGKIGFHGHDNLKNASVKAIDALYNGADIVDVTFNGFGRGSGNAKSEYVLAHFQDTEKYKLLPSLIYTDKWIESYKNSGIPYLLTGLKSMHVNYAIEVIEKHDNITIEQVWDVFNKIIKMDKHHFYSSEILTQYM
jgi:4-hydroxy 2-oxovalerate aldolase